jgi:hypothetical protein
MIKMMFSLMTLLLSVVSARAEDLLLGVLEQPQSEFCSSENANPKQVVRPLFAKSAGDWVALKSRKSAKAFNIKPITWTAAFDGKNAGQVVSQQQKTKVADDWTYPRDYSQNVVSKKGRVEIPNTKDHFLGWCGSPALRPVVLVSQPKYEDPDGWKPFQPGQHSREQIFEEFRKSFGKASLCYVKDDKPLPLKYSAKDLKFLKSYKSKVGEIIQVTLNREYINCNDDLDEVGSSRWFFKTSESIKFIGAAIEVVDAGDYDADGESELIFWYSGYNNNGYVLFYGGFQKRVDFLWTYH